MYKTNPVRAAGSLTTLMGKLASAIAMEEKNVTKEEKCKKYSCTVLCNTSVLILGAVISSKIKSKSYTKTDQLASSAHDTTIVMYWRVLLKEFSKLRKVMLLAKSFLNYYV